MCSTSHRLLAQPAPAFPEGFGQVRASVTARDRAFRAVLKLGEVLVLARCIAFVIAGPVTFREAGGFTIV